ncbi:alpha/beta hydrolase family protein [Paenibacillus sp. GCM10023252]|uniref:alpha/beta hydrolase family protein n=1 Tax=Paenibacillus sp. GCM10023252 TaxID=3252649 RepID=UPI00360642DC
MSILTERFELTAGQDLIVRGRVSMSRQEGAVRRPVLIICHGFKAFAGWGFFPYTADWFAERGFYTVLFDFSCNGVRDRDFDELDKFALNTYSREQKDLALVMDALRQGKLPHASSADSAKLHLLGHSRGGGNAIIFAAEHSAVCSIAVWNSIASPQLLGEAAADEAKQAGVTYIENARTKQQMPISYTFFKDIEDHLERFAIARRLSELAQPALLIQGDQDSSQLVDGYRQLQLAAPQHKYRTIAGGTHTFGAVHPFQGTTLQLEQALDATFAFFKE